MPIYINLFNINTKLIKNYKIILSNIKLILINPQIYRIYNIKLALYKLFLINLRFPILII